MGPIKGNIYWEFSKHSWHGKIKDRIRAAIIANTKYHFYLYIISKTNIYISRKQLG